MTDIIERLMARNQQARERGGDMLTIGEGDLLAVEAAKEIEGLRAALEEIASGLSVRDPYHIANEALGRAVTS